MFGKFYIPSDYKILYQKRSYNKALYDKELTRLSDFITSVNIDILNGVDKTIDKIELNAIIKNLMDYNSKIVAIDKCFENIKGKKNVS